MMPKTVKTPINDPLYDAWVNVIQARFIHNSQGQQLFTVDANNLFEQFLAKLPDDHERQHHTCNACRRFMETYGGLVTIDTDGNLHSAIWHQDDVPVLYESSVLRIKYIIEKARVTGVFHSAEQVWGQPETHGWHHFAVIPSHEHVWTSTALSASQRMAEQHEHYRTLCQALPEYSIDLLEKAVALIKSGVLYRGDKVQGAAEWLLDLQQRRKAATIAHNRENITWRAVAVAPVGFCTPKGNMIGSLLDDLAGNLNVSAVARRFAEKMNPQQYGHAQTPPSEGAIRQAEKLFDQMGLEAALHRRYATFDDLPDEAFLWVPRAKAQQVNSGGVFSHLREPRGVTERARTALHIAQATPITWEKFSRTVLGTANKIEVLIPNSADHFMALVTSVSPDAPPILQWDSPEHRNPVSWYYAGGIDAEVKKRLTAARGRFTDVDIRGSLIWNTRDDLDLQAITPSNDHIYWSDKNACRYGGELDVDRNVNGETSTPVENIRWPSGQAPNGTYKFYVNLYRRWESRGEIPFMAEIEIAGRVFTVSGVIDHMQQANNFSKMVKIAEFTYLRGDVVRDIGSATAQKVSVNPNAWNVSANTYVPVTAVVSSPNLWGKLPLTQHGAHAFLLLDGCKDTQEGIGRGFMTQTLRSELHQVRSVMEAYVVDAPIEGKETAYACGVGMSKEGTGDLIVRVTNPAGVMQYMIDRWD